MSRPPSSNIMNDTRYQTPSSTTTSNTQSQVIIIKTKKILVNINSINLIN
jgi:hypothetical protein